MRQHEGAIRLSASDLMAFMGCRHRTRLDLMRSHGEGPEPAGDSEDAELLQAHGDAHERAFLERLRAAGRSVAEIDTERQSFETAVARTRAALEAGPDVIFQGALAGGAWGGYADFLERVEEPSALGAFSYEVADTKLKRSPDPKHVLQLVLYSDLLAAVQGRAPARAHLELGTSERATLRLQDFAAYARLARERLEGFVAEPPETRPEPCGACPLCRWREHCQETWERTDSLVQVAGITRGQRAKLEAAGVTTMAALAERQERVPRLAAETLEKLRVQARLQTPRRHGGPPSFELRPHQPGRGFDLLPRPDPGDIFYDIEGDPWVEGGLEYLHGLLFGDDGGERFEALWAHDREAEGRALDRLLDVFADWLARFPNAHVYHYAAYEVTALRRLAMLHGRGEALIDQMLREGRFVDLYAVVRGALFASEPGYSIKDLEAFYMSKRAGEVQTAGGSVVAYERWRETREQAILDEILDYNRIDCVSTRMLRDWLVAEVRPAGHPWPVARHAGHDGARVEEEDAEADALRARLAASPALDDRLRTLLFDLAFYHRREAKPAWWAVFDRAGKESEELLDDLDCVAGLEATGPAEDAGKSWERAYRFEPQETKLREDGRPNVMTESGPRGVTLLAFDPAEGNATLRFGKSSFDEAPDRLDLLPASPFDAGVIEQALGRAIADLAAGSGRYAAAGALVAKAPPRLRGRDGGPVLGEDDVVAGTVEAIARLDASVLPIQGPPGTGKTYVASHAILALARQGRRVAVTSNSHKAIDNLLCAVLDRAIEQDVDIEVAKKIGSGERIGGRYGDLIAQVGSNDARELQTAQVVGGTAWLLSRPEFDGAFNTLVVDEAGQVSLANALAVSTAARNLVLVGDPMQLPQVVQGAHPGEAGLSCLEYLLGEARTVAPERGVFLPVSRRMHRGVCRFVSEQVYDGRLGSHREADAQRLGPVPGLPPMGAHLVEIAHAGNTQCSEEEAAAVAGAVDTLLGTPFTDRKGRTAPLRLDDILVVAPYNAQVNLLRRTLPPGARVGTVDRFQGQEAPVCLVSLATSSADEIPRGLEFLFSLNRLNVAVSRAQALALVFASPALLETPCSTVEQMRLVNALCALREHGRALGCGSDCGERG